MKTSAIVLFVIWTLSSSAQELYYPPITGETWETISMSEIGWCKDEVPTLISFLEDSDTKAFIVLKDGKIVIEEYQNDHTQDSVWYWASAGKSLKAFEIGMLQESGDLDINTSTSDYLGTNWTSCDNEAESAITLKHQLSMSTGLDYTDGELDCTSPECLKCLNDPNTEWYYHNGPYTLLTDVIENVTNLSHSVHTFTTLGNQIGLRGAWIPLGSNKTFFSTPRVMARFGLLMNGRGTWNGTTILGNQSYFDQMTTPSQNINQSYGYLWWLNTGPTYRLPSSTITFQGKLLPDAPEHIYMAIGKNSQLLIVDPIENIVIVRMGDDPDQSLVPTNFIINLWEQLSEVICTSTSTTEERLAKVKIYPNPTSNKLSIESNFTDGEISILDISGKQLMTISFQNSIDVSLLKSGVYLIEFNTGDEVFTEKFIKY